MLYFANVAQPAWVPAYWAAYVVTLSLTHLGINGQVRYLYILMFAVTICTHGTPLDILPRILGGTV